MSVFAFPETTWHRSRASDFDTITFQPPKTSSPTRLEANEEKTAASDLETQIPSQPHRFLHSALQRGKPEKHQFNLFQTNSRPLESLFSDIWATLKLFAFPIVDFASFVVSWSASSFLIVNLTQAQAFSKPPYRYTPQTIGFFNFAVVIGLVLGMVTAGPLNDWISMRATKRNKGIREPEMRLPAMIPYTLIMILGNFVVGFGYQYHWDWRVRPLPLLLPLLSQPASLTLPWRIDRFTQANLMLPIPGDRYHRIYVCWHSGSSPASHRIHLRHRLVQARHRLHLHQYHRGQESLGLWSFALYYRMEHY